MNYLVKSVVPNQVFLLIISVLFAILAGVLVVITFKKLFSLNKDEILSLKHKMRTIPQSGEEKSSSQGGIVNNYYINEINVNSLSSKEEKEVKDITDDIEVVESIDATTEAEQDEDDAQEVLEEENEIKQVTTSNLDDIKEGIIDYAEQVVEEDVEDTRISTPRHMSLKLRLCNSSDRLKSRYSKIRNHLENYKIRERFLKHRDIYYVLKEVIINESNGNITNKTERYKVAMMTVRRKQLILSLNIDLESLDSSVLEKNIVIEQKRYQGYTFNMKVSSEKDCKTAINLIDSLIDKNKVNSKKKHKEVDYVSLFSEDLSNFERRGFGYLIRPMIKLDESEQYKDSLAVKAIVLNKLDETAPTKSVPFEISLDKINDLFDGGSKINLETFKNKGLAAQNTNKLIISDGKYLNKKFYIDADGFSTNAIKMIFLTGGEARINHRISISK